MYISKKAYYNYQEVHSFAEPSQASRHMDDLLHVTFGMINKQLPAGLPGLHVSD